MVLPFWVAVHLPTHQQIHKNGYIKVETTLETNSRQASKEKMPSTTKIDPNEYTLRLLTNEDHVQFTRYQNADTWKGRLSKEKYMMREATLLKSKIASSNDNKLYVFALHHNDEDEKFFCSVELLVRESWRFEVEDGEAVRRSIKSGCIGGVYTYPEYRGKGYASIMIDRLVEIAKEEYIGQDGFIFLYSEVGEYYSRFGFKSLEVPITHVPLQVEDSVNDKFEKLVESNPYKVELVNYHEFEPIFKKFNSACYAKFLSETKKDGKPRVSIDPSSDYIDWFHLRAKYLSHHIYYDEVPLIDYQNESYDSIIKNYEKIEPSKFGIEITNNGEIVGFIVWSYEFQVNDDTNKDENYITIIQTYVNENYNYNDTLLNLIELTKSYLEKQDLFKDFKNELIKLVIWESELNDSLIEKLNHRYNSKLGIENGSRSAILIYNGEDQNSLINGDLIWELNNKLPWF